MKPAVFSLIMLFSTSAFANWKLQHTQHKQGDTPQLVAETLSTFLYSSDYVKHLLLQKQVNELAGLKAKQVTFISVTLKRWKWEGPNSSCKMTDPRQFMNSEYGEVWYQNSKHKFNDPLPKRPNHWDPCREF